MGKMEGGDTLTLDLTGEVTLGDLAIAVAELRTVVAALTSELAGGSALEWVIDDLQAGSAAATVRGVGDPGAVIRVVRAYEEVGEALEQQRPVPYGRRVGTAARRISRLANGRISAVRFETAERDFVIAGRRPVSPVERPPEAQTTEQARPASRTEAWGALEGRIQTLTNRGGLRFTLYDTHFDRAVSCYLDPSYPHDRMKDVWGRRALVEGWIKRDPVSGRPVTIRRIREIKVIPDPVTGGYVQARGLLPFDGRRSEEYLRELRDA